MEIEWPLVFKKSFRDRVDNVPVFIDDKSTSFKLL